MATWVFYLVWLSELRRRHGLEPTPREFADHVRIPLGRAKVALLRLQRRGLARRRKDPGPSKHKRQYRYRLSTRGLREARVRGRDPDTENELLQMELFYELKRLANAGKYEEVIQYYVTRRNSWGSGLWRHLARDVLFQTVIRQIRADKEMARGPEAVLAGARPIAMLPEPSPEPRALDRTRPEADSRGASAPAGADSHRAPAEPARPPHSRHVCSIASLLPPYMRGGPVHIILEPAVNPFTGEFLVDHENLPVYNETIEPWAPEPREMIAPEVAAAAVAAVLVAYEYRATILSEKHKARTIALQAENDDLRSNLRMKTLEASLSEELHRMSLVLAERQLADERDRTEMGIAAQEGSFSTDRTTAAVIGEGFATLDAALERGSERLDQSVALLKPLVQVLGRVFEIRAERRHDSVIRAAPTSTERVARVKVKTI